MVGKTRSLLRPAAAGGLFLFAALLVSQPGLAQQGAKQGAPIRPDAPKKPNKGEFPLAEPKDWTPPTLEELQKLEWKPGRVTDANTLHQQRWAKYSPTLTDEQAIATKNVSDETNRNMLMTLSRPPRSDDEVDWDATFNRWTGGAVETMNPILQSSKYEQEAISGFMAGPWSFDHEMKPFADADVVAEWKTHPTHDLIVLRTDLWWEDGTPFTAYDIEFSYHVIMNNQINVPAVRSGTEELKWVKAYNDTTLVYFHKEPLVTNVWNINYPIVPKHIYSPGLAEDPTMVASEWNNYWNQHPLTNGAYYVKEHSKASHILFERREEWYLDKKTGKQLRAKPYLKTVRFRVIQDQNAALLAFKKGELDEMLLSSRQYVKETDGDDFKGQGVKLNGEEWTFSYMSWNQKPIPDVPYFKDQKVRHAMSYAFDHEEMLKEIFFGQNPPAACPFHPNSWMHHPDIKPFTQDLDKAEALLDEAGWIDTDEDGVRDKTIDGKKWPFEFTMLVPAGGGSGEKVAIMMKENLESIGVKMTIKLLEWATYLQNVQEHRFEANTAAWGTGVDPDTAKNLWMTKAHADGRNYVGYSNARVDELFELGQKEFDPEKRKAIYQEIDLLIHQDQPYTFTNFRRTFWAFSKRIRGYDFSPREVFGYSPGPASVWIPKKKS